MRLSQPTGGQAFLRGANPELHAQCTVSAAAGDSAAPYGGQMEEGFGMSMEGGKEGGGCINNALNNGGSM